MSNYIVKDSELIDIADAIRTKGGTSESLLFPTGMVSAIQSIPSGGNPQAEIIKILTARAKYYAYGQITGYIRGNETFNLKSDYAFIAGANDKQGIAISISPDSGAWNYSFCACHINNSSSSTLGVYTSMSSGGGMTGGAINTLGQFTLKFYAKAGTVPSNNVFFVIFDQNFTGGTPTRVNINDLVTSSTGTLTDL